MDAFLVHGESAFIESVIRVPFYTKSMGPAFPVLGRHV